MTHPLLDSATVAAVERAASKHFARSWIQHRFTVLDDRASHPCGVFAGDGPSVFAKYSDADDARAQFDAEVHGLRLIRECSGVTTPTPVGGGVIDVDGGSLLLLEAVPERMRSERIHHDWRAIGAALAQVHRTTGDEFGLATDGFFGPLPQDNRPILGAGWAEFYGERRVRPNLRLAVDAGHLPSELIASTERLMLRLGSRCGPEVAPTLLHGDAQQNNFISAPTGAVLVDTTPYFGHPELDLALVDYFQPVPDALFDGYREHRPIDEAGRRERCELWRIHAYLAVIAVDGANPFGRSFIDRLDTALRRYA